jgi:hypothetical protein
MLGVSFCPGDGISSNNNPILCVLHSHIPHTCVIPLATCDLKLSERKALEVKEDVASLT